MRTDRKLPFLLSCSSSSSVACSLSIRKYTVRVASSMVSPEPFSELHQRAAYVSENINRQWRTCSLQMHQLVSLIMWSDTRRLSLRETHLPMILNRGADLLSRGNPLYGEWKLYPQVVNQIWQRSLWGEGEFTTLTQTGSSLGLTHERWNLNAAGLHLLIMHTIQSARAPSTCSLYINKWRVFEEQCE